MIMEDLLLAILVVLALAAVRSRDLLASTAVLGAYSLVMAVLWCTMNALDVGFTEAAVGAGISTVLMLAALVRIGRWETGGGLVLKPALLSVSERGQRARERDKAGRASSWGAMFVCVLLAAVLVYGAVDMPAVGNADSPANSNKEVALRYMHESAGHDGEVGPANVVTSVLGDYRGYDTMGETVVIFTAALCVMLLLRHCRPAPRRRKKESGGAHDG
jgi:multicomponent Na+:H+ antiporter subunit B